MSLYILLVLTAKFNLEIMQLDVINTFIHIDINKIVFMYMLFRYSKNEKILCLNKVFYNL